MLIDTHSHIYLPEFDDDRVDVIARIRQNEITKVIFPNIDSSSVDDMLNLYNSDKNLFACTNGLHPTSVNETYKEELNNLYSDEMQKRMSEIVAIGEIGMDLYWDKTFVEEQKYVLDFQLNYAVDHNLPVIIHCRNAFNEIYDIVKTYKDKNLRGVFHCFSESVEDAAKVVDLGFMIGVGGVLTYKKSTLPNVVTKISSRNIILETDCPYLTPAPHRGKRNESSYVVFVAQKLAELLNCSYENVCDMTTRNAKELFNI